MFNDVPLYKLIRAPINLDTLSYEYLYMYMRAFTDVFLLLASIHICTHIYTDLFIRVIRLRLLIF